MNKYTIVSAVVIMEFIVIEAMIVMAQENLTNQSNSP
jgi:hypothetical protein